MHSIDAQATTADRRTVMPLSSEAKTRLLRSAKWLIVLTVAFFIARSFQAARQELRSTDGFSLTEISLAWLIASGLMYALAMIPMGLYWHVLNGHFGQSARWWPTFAAYCVGHLGKYVPGKAMVVVLRTSLLRSDQTSSAVIATTVFIETFTMMSVGAALAAILIGWQFAEHHYLLVLAVVLTGVAALPTWPPLLRALVARLRPTAAGRDMHQALQGYRGTTMLIGWGLELVGWALIGVSLGCVMKALPTGDALPSLVELWPRLTASTSLSMVAGFLSLIPGGLGVREAVLDQLLKQPFGPITAFVVPIVLRLVWLLTELVVSSILYFSVTRQQPTGKRG